MEGAIAAGTTSTRKVQKEKMLIDIIKRDLYRYILTRCFSNKARQSR